MPRYYFNLHDDGVTIDDEGTECPDLETASQKALEAARSMAADSILRSGHLALSYRVEVLDSRGKLVATVRFSDAIQIRNMLPS